MLHLGFSPVVSVPGRSPGFKHVRSPSYWCTSVLLGWLCGWHCMCLHVYSKTNLRSRPGCGRVRSLCIFPNSGHRWWAEAWLFLFPLSVLQILPDWFLSRVPGHRRLPARWWRGAACGRSRSSPRSSRACTSPRAKNALKRHDEFDRERL
jgi:hypothetical protein